MTQTATITAGQQAKGAFLLRLIGVFKATKAVILIAAAVSVFRLTHENVESKILQWAHRFHVAPGNRYVTELIDKVLTVTHRQLLVIGVVLLIYAAMFLIEGVGLLLLQHWAEWMTVTTTGGLIPFEVYELMHRPSWPKATAMAINVIVAVYLAFRVLRPSRLHASAPAVNPS